MSRTDVSYTTLIDPADLMTHLTEQDWVVVDCRCRLADPSWGRIAYQSRHIPGAVYFHLDDDLSGDIVPGKTGRHPLPDVDEFADLLARSGIHPSMQIVAYDDNGGGVAARFWWMMRWVGHERVAVLNGGWQAWERSGFPVEARSVVRPSTSYEPVPDATLFVDTDFVETVRLDPNYKLIDARAPERYSGTHEPIDPIPGHIPGAVSFPFARNLDSDLRFRPIDELLEQYNHLLGEIPPEQAICYCGSGVTAAHTLLALEYVGLGKAKLYPGSWSEWITDTNRPVEPALD